MCYGGKEYLVSEMKWPEDMGRNSALCMKERKEKEELYMVDHGSVFNLKQRWILGSGRIQQGTC